MHLIKLPTRIYSWRLLIGLSAYATGREERLSWQGDVSNSCPRSQTISRPVVYTKVHACTWTERKSLDILVGNFGSQAGVRN